MTDLFRQFVRFSSVGAMSAVGHFGLLILLVKIGGVPAVIASSAGALLGACINYSLNYRFTFHSNKRHTEGISKFSAVALVGMLLNACFMSIGVTLLHVNYLLSQLVATGLVMVWNFLGNRYWTFSRVNIRSCK